MRYALCSLLVVMMLCAAVVAADKRSKFKVGDKVIVDFGGEKTGEVVGFVNGWLKLRVKDENGFEQTPVLPPERVKAAKKTAKSSVKKKPAAAKGELREWASKSGKFKVQAKF